MAAVGCVAVALEDTAEVSQQIAEAGLLAARVPLIENVAAGAMKHPEVAFAGFAGAGGARYLTGVSSAWR